MDTKQQITTLVELLFEPRDLVEIRTLPGGKQVWCMAGDLPGYTPPTGMNVYFGVNPRSRRGGTAGDVALARSLFVDFDGPGPAEAAEKIRAAGVKAVIKRQSSLGQKKILFANYSSTTAVFMPRIIGAWHKANSQKRLSKLSGLRPSKFAAGSMNYRPRNALSAFCCVRPLRPNGTGPSRPKGRAMREPLSLAVVTDPQAPATNINAALAAFALGVAQDEAAEPLAEAFTVSGELSDDALDSLAGLLIEAAGREKTERG